MSCIRSFCMVAAAAEALVKGFNITEKTRADLKAFFDDDKSIYNILIDDETKEMFKLSSHQVYREGRVIFVKKEEVADFEPNITLTIEKVKDIMQVLWQYNIEGFTDFKEEDYIKGYEKIIHDMDKDYSDDLEMKKELTRDKTDEALKIFLALFNYPNNYSKILYDDSKIDKYFPLNKAKDFEVIDNRMYVPIKPSLLSKVKKNLAAQGYAIPDEFKEIKAFVVSKNVYDYFWASYGNNFQSCFALNSEYGYLYGYVPFASAQESFICYATTGGVNKIPIISGKQFRCPNMLFRCWGYADDEGHLLVDKKYFNKTTRNEVFVEEMINALKPYLDLCNDRDDPTHRTLYNGGVDIQKIAEDTNCQFYADSLRFTDCGNLYFEYGNGSNTTGRVKYPWSNTHKKFTDYASTITSVSPTLTLDKHCAVVDGVLLNPKKCPITGFQISDTDTHSPYAKFFTRECTKSAMITYIGGQVFLDEFEYPASYCDGHSFWFKKAFSRDGDRRGFFSGVVHVLPYTAVPDSCNKSLTLKTLKEMLTGEMKYTDLDGILLRYFEGHEVKYQFYKKRA